MRWATPTTFELDAVAAGDVFELVAAGQRLAGEIAKKFN